MESAFLDICWAFGVALALFLWMCSIKHVAGAIIYYSFKAWLHP